MKAQRTGSHSWDGAHRYTSGCLASPAHAAPSCLQTYQVKLVNVAQQLVNG